MLASVPEILVEAPDGDASEVDAEPQVWSRIWSRDGAKAASPGNAGHDDQRAK
jgi:hypothetical protein